MSFGFGASASSGNTQIGPDLEDIQTEALGFLSISGESKVQLLPSPWPADNLPPPNASLLSVASRKGLIAAAGPDFIIVASTESVRKAFEGPVSGDGNLKSFEPQLKIPMSMRISQLAFSADENYLVVSAEAGGGLAVYDAQSLMNGSTQAAFELSTNGKALRIIAPNPTPDKGELLALVTVEGNLMMANLKDRNFVIGTQGPVLKGGVSSISWSTKGKQLVAGLGDGTAYQMTPEGEGKADIPRPPSVNVGDHVSSISWLENHVFLVVHTPSVFDNNQIPPSTFHIVTRTPPSSYMFQKISDPVQPFGLNRSPSHYFVLRLRDYPPNLQDVLILASTASADIGLLTRSKTPLTNDKPAEKISGVFTMTEMSDDSRRAQLPISSSLGDTSPIGFSLDLSGNQNVAKPIPGDEMSESATPLPSVMVLNNEGALASWWLVYSDSIRQRKIYPGLVAAARESQTKHALAPGITQGGDFNVPSKPGFGVTPFGAHSQDSTFRETRPTSVVGNPAVFGQITGAFGTTSGLGKSPSPWGNPAASNVTSGCVTAFGTSSFGSAMSTPAPASVFGASTFGNPSMPTFALGNRSSPWQSGGSTPSATFGQPGGIGNPAPIFGRPTQSSGSAAPTDSGFAAFASKGGFSKALGSSGATGSVFSSNPTINSFTSSPQNSSSVFGKSSGMKSTAGLGGAGSFVLGSSFTTDPSVKTSNRTTLEDPKDSLFGSSFKDALSNTPAPETTISEETDMESDGISNQNQDITKVGSTTPDSTPRMLPFISATPSRAICGDATTDTPTSQPVCAGFNFGRPLEDNTKDGTLPFSSSSIGSIPKKSAVGGATTPNQNQSIQKNRVESPNEALPKTQHLHVTPLPPNPQTLLSPDPTNQSTSTASNSSNVCVGDDAPLPPDFVPKAVPNLDHPSAGELAAETTKFIPADSIPPIHVPSGPEEEEGEEEREEEVDSEFLEEDDASEEGSGEDVTKDLSHTLDTNQVQDLSPESSFGFIQNGTPQTNIFSRNSKCLQGGKSLFGEIKLPPLKIQASPRSPSPIRNAVLGNFQRPDPTRSVSAPGAAMRLTSSPRTSVSSKVTNEKSYAIALRDHKFEEARRKDLQARKESEETKLLLDEEDEQLQQFLASEIVPTTKLDEFIAHFGYISTASVDCIPAQVETVYRDVNSMIDTLGQNARALKAFIQGHTEGYKEETRCKDDLENDSSWVLVEIENLSAIVEGELTHELEISRINDATKKIEICTELQNDLVKLRAKYNDIKKIIAFHNDPDHLVIIRGQPLGAEQVAQQHDLRRNFTNLQKLLSEAEEGLSVLKTKMITRASSRSKAGAPQGPTVENVMRTISRMTTMVEKRSGDVDFLEGKMRRLRLCSSASVGSLEVSPFASSRKQRWRHHNPSAFNTRGVLYSPESLKDARFQSSLNSSVGSFTRSSSPRKILSGYSAEDRVQLRAELARKKEVKDKVRAALKKAGTNVRQIENEA